MTSEAPLPARTGFPWWIVAGALLLPSIYLPNLTAPFDFNDDGSLVYPSTCETLEDELALVWQKTLTEQKTHGPFRPMTQLCWQLLADNLDGDPLLWRVVRYALTAAACGMLLTLFRELGVIPVAALLAAAVAMWNPYRNEAWMRLIVPEGDAMPFALFGLYCAVRAGRSPHPWRWDLGGMLSILTALGFKNTFAALVPAQVVLRLLADGQDWRTSWRRHGWNAACLTAPLLAPIIHLLVLHSDPSRKVHEASWPTLPHVGDVLLSVGCAVGSPWLALGLVLAAWAAGREGLRRLWTEHRPACAAGLALLASGVAVYLPIAWIQPRYTMPAVWGVDLLLAALFSVLVAARWSWRSFAAYVVLGVSLGGGLLANLEEQDRLATRSRMLWQAAACIEAQAPANAVAAWITDARLERSEGVHFAWHIQARGRPGFRLYSFDVNDHLLLDEGEPYPERLALPRFAIAGGPPNPSGPYAILKKCVAPFRDGPNAFQCFVWVQAKPWPDCVFYDPNKQGAPAGGERPSLASVPPAR